MLVVEAQSPAVSYRIVCRRCLSILELHSGEFAEPDDHTFIKIGNGVQCKVCKKVMSGFMYKYSDKIDDATTDFAQKRYTWLGENESFPASEYVQEGVKE